MAWPPRFLFTGGRLCVDFALAGAEGRWPQWERWNEPQDLADWFGACSLALKLERVRPAELKAAKELRAVIWRTAHRVAGGAAPTAAEARALEARAARPDLVPVWRRGRVAWSADATVSQALSTVARDALTLFGTDAKQRLRVCRHPACPLLFVDNSRPGRRAWCAMRRCGNMAKTARYRRRKAATRSRPEENS